VRASAYLALGRFDDALRSVTPLLEADPLDDEALALQSRARAQRDGVKPEIERLTAALAAADARRFPISLKVLAGLLRLDGRADDAVRTLERLGDDEPGALALRAEIAAETGAVGPALELYQAALRLRPAALQWRRALAEQYGPERAEEALAAYDQLVAADPRNAGLQADRAVAQMRAGHLAEAEAGFREALRLDGSLPEAHFDLGLLASRQGNDQEAEAHYRRALELEPTYVKAHLNLARIYRARGDPHAAFHAEQAARASSTLDDRAPAPP
jgi:tetratricopeptide (TPR) repeat protein